MRKRGEGHHQSVERRIEFEWPRSLVFEQKVLKFKYPTPIKDGVASLSLSFIDRTFLV